MKKMKNKRFGKTAVLLLLIGACLCGCGDGGKEYTAEEIEIWLRCVLPDQKPIDTSGAKKFDDDDGNEAENRYWFHSAVYHGLIHTHSSEMSADAIYDNLEAFAGPAVLVADPDFIPGEYDEKSELWHIEPHTAEENLFYVVHDEELGIKPGDYARVRISCIGYTVENGMYNLYTFAPDGTPQIPDRMKYMLYDDIDALRGEIRANPDQYELLTVSLHYDTDGLRLLGLAE